MGFHREGSVGGLLMASGSALWGNLTERERILSVPGGKRDTKCWQNRKGLGFVAEQLLKF